MGESIDPHDKVILADTNRVANAIARGVCKAFNVNFDGTTTVPPVVTPVKDWKSYLMRIKTIFYAKDTIGSTVKGIDDIIKESGV
jgi:hypothetical protein